MTTEKKLLAQFKNALANASQENQAKENSEILKEHQLKHVPVSESHRQHVNHTDSHVDRIEKNRVEEPQYPAKTPTKR